jgi:hypothetical protein
LIANPKIDEYIDRIADLLSDRELRLVLKESLVSSQSSLDKIERCFSLLPSCRWSSEQLAQFLNSWKATHLKMLAIYGLSCRLQRRAMNAESDSASRAQLMLASAHNAETSYEDLGLDFGGETHAQLYNDFAEQLLGDFPWSQEKYCIPEAREFRGWIYQNMVVSDISIGLFTNMFSEIYNHAEYSIALSAFSEYMDRHYALPTANREKALQYIYAHVAAETEVDHFLVVVKALNAYCAATQSSIDYQQARQVFEEYLSRIGQVMESLTTAMEREKNAAATPSITTAVR